MALSVAYVLTSDGCASAETQPPRLQANTTEFECVIEPHQVVKLASSVVGVISRLDVDRGDLVHRDQILGKLEDRVEEAALALARVRASNVHTIASTEARLRFLRRKHERTDELRGKLVSSQVALEEAEAEAKIAEEQLKEAELAKELTQVQVQQAQAVLDQRILRSPIDGVVVERLLVPGEYRNEQTPVLTLAQIDLLRVEVYVPTAYYGQIRKGSTANVRPEQPIGGAYTATVTVVDQVLDAASGTFGVRLALPNPELRLPAGVACKISFEVPGTAEMPSFRGGSLSGNVIPDQVLKRTLKETLSP